jgi:hypothetical protein
MPPLGSDSSAPRQSPGGASGGRPRVNRGGSRAIRRVEDELARQFRGAGNCDLTMHGRGGLGPRLALPMWDKRVSRVTRTASQGQSISYFGGRSASPTAVSTIALADAQATAALCSTRGHSHLMSNARMLDFCPMRMTLLRELDYTICVRRLDHDHQSDG